MTPKFGENLAKFAASIHKKRLKVMSRMKTRQKICALQSYDQVFFLRSMSVVPVQALIVSSSCALKGGVMNKIYIDDV